VRQLEAAVGTQLFYRHGRGIRLTEKGEQFQAAVEPPVRQLRAAKDALKSSVDVPTGSISIGMPPSVSAVVGSRIVEEFVRRYPRVKLRLVDAFSGYVNEWLVSGRLDMAVINGARRSQHVRMEPLLTVDLFHVARRDMVEAGERNETTIQFDRLLTSPLILPGRHHGLRRQLDSAAQRQGRKLNVVVEIDALEALKDLVRRGVGPTVLPHGVILKEFTDAQLVVRRIVAPDVSMQFMLAYSLQRQTTLAMRELARVLRVELRRAVAEGRLMGRV
jgi:LysR family nitrogen assimilation transcriptional regulator